MTAQIARVIDILIVFVASGLAYWLEGFVDAQGWVSVAADARGVSAVIGGALTAVAVVKFRGGTLADLGFRRPERWAMVPLQVIAIIVAFIAMQAIAPMLVGSFIDLPKPDLSKYGDLSGNIGAALTFALILPFTASIPEEIIYRGFLMGRLSEIFGMGRGGAVATVLIQAVIFGSIHFSWGVGGIIVTFMMGIVWGTAFLLCRRNLWVVIIAHSTAHTLGILQGYLATSIII
ncbi:MAG: membrane protease YdiL (CAAX protease family) [Limisphaerales bacterium]|jgi:membrane protease YdiL (CAAX protease family)